MGVLTSQGTGVQISAVRWPPCQCGRAYALHTVADCPGYRPSRPVEDLGTRAYRPPASLALWRQVICSTLWQCEFRVQRWRESLGRS
jgi:hypothetical protein